MELKVTDDDINSPLVSYLLAKVQRLKVKMRAKPNVRNTREVEKCSVDANTSADDKKTKDCLQQVVTYIRWGNTTCPYGANTVYKGTAVGGHYDHKGLASNMVCLPLDTVDSPTDVGGNIIAYAVEYHVYQSLNHAECRSMPCVLCELLDEVIK